MIALLEPLVRIGDFLFGSAIKDYLTRYEFEHTPKNNSTGWESYDLEYPGLSIYVENSKIIAIACYEECRYKDKNIIGMKFQDFLEIYDLIPDEPPDNLDFIEGKPPQQVYEFGKIGLQIWTEEGTIVTVIASK